LSIRENEIEMELVGSPRWWTITNSKGTREVVRVIFEKGKHYDSSHPEAPDEMVLFAILQPDHFKWPPLVTAALRMGSEAWKEIEERGGEIVPYPTERGRKLELMLVGVYH
jgi:hypothetical protein